MSEATWYDYVVLASFVIVFLYLLVWGDRFMRLRPQVRNSLACGYFAVLFGWVVLHHL